MWTDTNDQYLVNMDTGATFAVIHYKYAKDGLGAWRIVLTASGLPVRTHVITIDDNPEDAHDQLTTIGRELGAVNWS